LNIGLLEQQIKELELVKIRFSAHTIDLFNQLDTSKQAESTAQSVKQAKKALNLVMETTLNSYKDRINQLLRSFGAQFLIPSIDFNYRSGLRSDYSLKCVEQTLH
jgi:hypothetical protein